MKRTCEDDSGGRVTVEVEMANCGDMAMARRGALPEDQVRRRTIQAIVDTGAVKLVLPEKIVNELGDLAEETINVRYADNRVAKRRLVQGVHLSLRGRHGIFNAVAEPDRETALVGAIVLEDLDLLVDCLNQRVVPRYPEFQLHEIE